MSTCIEPIECHDRRLASMTTIVRQLRAAEQWLKGQHTFTLEGNEKVRRLVAGCADLLAQSNTSYGSWAKRHAGRVKGRYTVRQNNKALRRLCELTISDIEACTWKRYVPPWQLAEWPTCGKLSTCPTCKNDFFGRDKYCGKKCLDLRFSAKKVSEVEKAPKLQMTPLKTR